MNSILTPVAILGCLLGLACVAPLYAADADSPIPTDDAELGEFVEGPKWQEETVTAFPVWPDEDKLLPIQMDNIDAPFRYFIDPASITVGKDYVSRYTVVIESDSGAKNVIYEGIRCRTGQYRVYAYGTSDNKLDAATVSEWQPIRITSSGAMIHRFNLHQYYLCDQLSNPRKLDDVLQEIRYPKPFKGGELYLN